MIRHIEFTIKFDLTCWGQDAEDFENDCTETINEAVEDYIINETAELLDNLIINRVWYEEG